MKLVCVKNIVDSVASLIRLRQWALAQLGGDAAAVTPDVPIETWRLFLELERCASPLLHQLTARGELNKVPAGAGALLASTAIFEARLALAAEREARRLAAAAVRAGTELILLKGGIPAVLGVSPALHVHDVDILVTDAARPVAERELMEGGFVPAAHDEPHHSHWDPPAGRSPVEIHWTTHADGKPLNPAVWRRVAPLDGVPGLSRLDTADQILHLLEHALDQHVERHVSIRDMLLLRWFAERMTAEERERLDDELASAAPSARHSDLLSFVLSLRVQSAPGRFFEADTILHFTAAILTRAGSLWGGPPPAWHRAAGVVQRPRSLPALIAFGGRSPVTGIDGFAVLQQKLPAAGAAITRAGRAAHYLVSAAVGAPLLMMVQRRVQRRLRS